MWYFAGFLLALLVDSIPVFAPPAWTLLAVLVAKFKIDPWGCAAAGAVGTTIGRFALSRYLPKISKRLLSRRRNENVAYAGKKLGGKFWPAFTFVLIYSLTPLSTTALFTAVGVARANPVPILPAFFIGKFLSDGVMLMSSHYAFSHLADIAKGSAEPKSIALTAVGFLLVVGMFLIDWRQLIEHRRVRLVGARRST